MLKYFNNNIAVAEILGMWENTVWNWKLQEIRKAMRKTLPWDSHSSASLEHIQSHNSYGYEYARAVSSAATNSQFLLSAVHTSNNQYATHAQNVNITWAEFKTSLIKTLSNSLFSENLHSIPVCGSVNFKVSLEYFYYKVIYAVINKYILKNISVWLKK